METVLRSLLALMIISAAAGAIVHSLRRHGDLKNIFGGRARWHPYIDSTISLPALAKQHKDLQADNGQAIFPRRGSPPRFLSPLSIQPLPVPRSPSSPTLSATFSGETCPKRVRNWRQLFGRKSCRKKCKTVKNCGTNYQSKLCLCDAECGMSCVKKNLNCPPLLAIKNGYLTYTANFPFDSTVAYSCEDDFILMGNSERRCRANGHWSGSEPTCVTSAKCGPPPEVPFAQHASYGQRQFDQGAMISYHCINGYYLSSAQGLTKAKCLPVNGTAVWFGPEMICTPITCNHPGDPLNGDRSGDSFQFPNSVRYKCHDGFVSVGSLIRRCQPNGRWSGDPLTCKPVECPKPDEPLHGHIVGSSLDYRAQITYTCEEGHRLVGQRRRVCQADRTWSGQASRCEAIQCDKPIEPKNGYVEGSDTNFGASIQYRCLEGSQLRGAEYARCQRDYTWSNPPPVCLASCEIPKIKHGQPTLGLVGRMVPDGSVIEFVCDSNYELDNPLVFTECRNGKWHPSLPTCVQIRCAKWPQNFANSIVLFVKSDANSMARYICKPGYKITNGNGIFRCKNGIWKGDDPMCKEVTCENPRSVEYIGKFNGSIKLEGSMGAYEYHDHFQKVGENRQIQFECPKGYTLMGGPNKATCLNGTWMPRFTPVCLPQEHPPLEERTDWSSLKNKRSVNDQQQPKKESWENALEVDSDDFDLPLHWRQDVRRKKRAAATENSYVLLSVKPPRRKRKRNHKNKTKEQLDTDYQGSYSYVWGSSCPPVRENERQSYAVIQHSPTPDGRFLAGSEVMIRCQAGYELPNPHRGLVTCRNGTWNPAIPACGPKSCKLPIRPNAFFTWRGEIVNSGHDVGHREGAKLFCLRGYELRGDDALECNLGSWLKTVGECVPQSCAIPFLRYGHYKNGSMPRASIEHASKVDFKCQHGFFSNPPSAEVHCSYGTLLPHDPLCEEDVSVQKPLYLSIGCTRPYDVDNAWVYIKEASNNRRLLINPQVSIFPNRTIVHYKCSESLDDDHRMMQGRKKKRALSSLYTADEAHAIECSDGEWVALLAECAPSGRLPPGVESNSTLLTNLQLFGANRLPCMRPNATDTTGVIFETNGWLFPHGFKLRVHCAKDGTKSWAIRCRRGHWKGIEDNTCAPIERPEVITTQSHSCDYNPINFKSMIVFYEQRKEPIVFKEQLPENALLTVRCQHVGLYQFTGTKKLLCRNGQWQGGTPRCRSLGIPWKEGQAPPIAYRATEGDLSLTNEGDIVLRKSSTLELDCLVPRQKAQPFWDYSNSYRKYPQQWSQFILEPWETGAVDETSNSLQLDAFRLTIFMARPEDSGIFHCITPSGLRHSVRVRVVDVDCPNHERLMKKNSIVRPANSGGQKTSSMALASTPNIQASKGNAFGSVLHFTCPLGYKIEGATRVYCLENGEWSNSMPTCESTNKTN